MVLLLFHDGVSHEDTLAAFEHDVQLLAPVAPALDVVPAGHAVHVAVAPLLYDPATHFCGCAVPPVQ